MVDENLVRKDISFAEMAQLAVHYAMDPLTAENDAEKAVAILFRSAGYQKRSYIRNFIPLVERLGEVLMYPQRSRAPWACRCRSGWRTVPGLVTAIRTELKDWDTRSITDELAVLRRYAGREVRRCPRGPRRGPPHPHRRRPPRPRRPSSLRARRAARNAPPPMVALRSACRGTSRPSTDASWRRRWPPCWTRSSDLPAGKGGGPFPRPAPSPQGR